MPTKNIQIRPVGAGDFADVLHPETNWLQVLNKSDASTTAKGITKLNDTLTSTSTTEAATANAVNLVNKRFDKSVLGGDGADAASSSIAIGSGAKAMGSYSIALGVGAGGTASVSGVVALGALVAPLNSFEGILGRNDAAVAPNVWKVPGNFSVTGTKNFEMPHPAPHKKDTHVIRHGAVESPTAGDTLYRYTIEATTDGETVELQLPDYFQYLNKNVDVWVSGDGHFGRAFGKVVEDNLLITCELVGIYKALVIGTRNDDHESVQSWEIKGVEREIGESWTGETYSFEVDEITEITEFGEVAQ